MPTFTQAYIQAAVNSANELGGLTGSSVNPHNDQYDAYRHAMLSADLTNLFGETISKMIMDDYESENPSNPPAEKNMDLWNNNVGREELKRWQQAIESGQTTDSLRKWVYDRVKAGETINDTTSDSRKWVEPGDYDYYKRPEFNRELNRPIDDLKKKFDKASTIPSPIILDLDGDGVESVAFNAGAYFDHASDGFAEQTGWVGKDDGLLVRDLNGNGTIDTGTELFGSETLLANGQKAATGFAAMADLDSNADGKLDASDAAFATLNIWKDANGDGFTSTGELLTLGDVGVQSINVGYTNSSLVDANGNQHQQVGSYTTTTGQARTATDVWFQTDSTYSIATVWLDVPADIAALPDVAGYGKVYDLHQAMVRDTSGSLKTLVTQFTQATTIADRETLLQSIIYKWTGVENVDPNSRAATMIYGNAIGDARKLEALEQFMGEEWYGVWCWGTKDPNPHGHAAPVLLEAYAELSEMIYGQLAVQSFLRPLYDKFNFDWDVVANTIKCDLSLVAADITAAINTNHTAGKELLSEFMRSLKGMAALSTVDLVGFETALSPLGLDVVSIVNSAWAVVGTDGSDFLTGGADADMLQGLGGNDTLTGNDMLLGGDGNDGLYGGNGDDVLAGGAGNDSLNGGAGNDLYLFGRGAGQDSINYAYDGMAGRVDTVQMSADIASTDVTLTRSGSDLVIAINGTTDKLTVGGYFYGDGAGGYQIDSLAFADGTNWTVADINRIVLQATAGNDTRQGYASADTLEGLDGNDNLYGNGGNDTLIGGLGNDYLQGDGGADTYRFSRGGGSDTINNYEYLAAGTANPVDAIVFDADIAPADIVVTRNWYGDLTLSISGSTDKVTVTGYFQNDAATSYAVEEIRFANGTVWNIDAVKAMALVANEAGSTLYGFESDDEITGATGNDIVYARGGNDTVNGNDGNDGLYGEVGNDTLRGGAGRDYLVGGDGNDTLDGGVGDDQLTGDTGADTYVFARGYGKDSINNYEYASKWCLTPFILAMRLPSAWTGSSQLEIYDCVIDFGGANYDAAHDKKWTGL